jgi:hypothetical protein
LRPLSPLNLACANFRCLRDAVGLAFWGEALQLPGGEDIVFFDALAKRECRLSFCRAAGIFETGPSG